MKVMLHCLVTHYNRLPAMVVAFFICFMSAGTAPVSQNVATPEYQLKAVFLFNFAQFIEWPDDTFSDKSSPIVIGVLGEDPFGPYLDETVKGETVNRRPLIVKRYEKLEEVKRCHILFVGEKDKKELKKILSGLDSRNILSVGETDGFGQMGGMIEFSMDNNKIGLQINPESAKDAHLVISSKLLRLAEIVSTENSLQ